MGPCVTKDEGKWNPGLGCRQWGGMDILCGCRGGTVDLVVGC